jgi:hypothetical protein
LSVAGDTVPCSDDNWTINPIAGSAALAAVAEALADARAGLTPTAETATNAQKTSIANAGWNTPRERRDATRFG